MAYYSLKTPQHLGGRPTSLEFDAALPVPSVTPPHFIFHQARRLPQYFIFELVVDIDFNSIATAEVIDLHLRSGLKLICSMPHRILLAFGRSDRFVG